MGISLNPEEMLEVFGDDDPREHEPEARELWGGTDAYGQSQRRTSSYSKRDWLGIKAASERVEARLAGAMAAGLPPESHEAMEAAEQHRANISRWYYDCHYDIHRALGEMYRSDLRFTAHYEERAAGLAAYVCAAIAANADRANGA
jgi:hypothetical protein